MPTPPTTFVGFGFGPIQAGLFLYEAFRSGQFERLVVAEIAPDVVSALRRAQGCYRINLATPRSIEVAEVRGVEILNPLVPEDARSLSQALADASEISTALPSVEFYAKGLPSVVSLLTEALRHKTAHDQAPRCLVYTGENHNHAAEILQDLCERNWPAAELPQARRSVQFLNTVIGKMSGTVTDAKQLRADGLATLVEGFPRAFLVEEFNRILVTQVTLPNFQRRIPVFLEKPDLLPFEEAKLYGHNAVHALLGYLAQRRGYRFMSDAAPDQSLMALALRAFLQESGAALIARHQALDPLFTPDGYRAYADDLLRRITNPHLRDRIDRVIRDTPRKLAWSDRLIGTMRLALDAGLVPHLFSLGAAAALDTLALPGDPASLLNSLWPVPDEPPGRKAQLIKLVTRAQRTLKETPYGKL